MTCRRATGGWETYRMGHSVLAIEMPPARDFVLSAGFAGVVALLAAVVVSGAVLYAARRDGRQARELREQSDRHHEEKRADERRATETAQCWHRWWQVVETAALEPSSSEGATLGLGPEVTLELLRGLLRDAERLGDHTLASAIAVYQEQLVLVLAQQSGPLAQLAASTPPSSNGVVVTPAADEPVVVDDPAPVVEEAPPAEMPSGADEEAAASGKR